MSVKIIALYLPQYYPFKENNEWWGNGFTEWTNVGRAKPLFKNHYQPRIPADLGYYDLRLPIVRDQQAKLAQEAGVYGFCYWHYWFGNGKRLMYSVFDDVLESGKPDFPFCLGWANHSWYSKNWNSNDTRGNDRLLIQQTYPGEEDIRAHYNLVLPAFKDSRYIKDHNNPLFMVYQPDDLPPNFIFLWNKWAVEDGFSGIYFIGDISANSRVSDYVKSGFSAVVKQRVDFLVKKKLERSKIFFLLKKIKSHLFGIPDRMVLYKDAMEYFVNEKEDIQENVIPSIIPNFDHSPRSGKYGTILHNSTPELFYKHVVKVLTLVKKKKNPYIILRSWNEWGEGNYLEPDIKYRRAYIETLRKAITDVYKGF